jgi:hypothetical protein
MGKLMDDVKTDASFIKSHTLQPQWYKILKVFILLGAMVGYFLIFGLRKTVVFFGVFFLMSLIVHMVYRVKTKTWRQSWLDFVVVEEENGELRYERIGKYYYSAVLCNAILALIVSQVWF